MEYEEIIGNYLLNSQSVFSAVIISQIGFRYFFEHYKEIAEIDVFSGFEHIDDIAKLTYNNRYILDIPWNKPEYLTDDEREYGSIDPADNAMSECIWAERGRTEIKNIANDFKNYCIEYGIEL